MKWVIVLFLLGHTEPYDTMPDIYNTKADCEDARAFATKFAPLLYKNTDTHPLRSECRLEDGI